MKRYTVYFTAPDGEELSAVYAARSYGEAEDLFRSDFGMDYDYVVEG